MSLRSDSNANWYTTVTIFKSDNYKSFPRTRTRVFFQAIFFNATQSFLCIRQYKKHISASEAYRETQCACNTKWKCFTLIELSFAVDSLSLIITSFSPIVSALIHVSKLLCQVSFVISH